MFDTNNPYDLTDPLFTKDPFMLDEDLPTIPDFTDITQQDDSFANGLGALFHPKTPVNPYVVMRAPQIPIVRKKMLPQKIELNIPRNVDLKLSEACPTRVWTVSHFEDFYGAITANVTMKIRTEKETRFVPRILYSSLQYVIRIALDDPNLIAHETLIAKIFVLDADTGEKMERDLQGNAPIKGVTESAVTKVRGVNTKMKGELKVRLGDVTFAKSGKDYMLEVEFYVPSDLEFPIFAVRTPTFRAYARKPNKKVKKKKGGEKKKRKKLKRKRKTDADAPEKKKRKKNNMEMFGDKLNDLLNIAQNLNMKKKKEAFDMLLRKVYQEFQ